jgi:hypothetical protein
MKAPQMLLRMSPIDLFVEPRYAPGDQMTSAEADTLNAIMRSRVRKRFDEAKKPLLAAAPAGVILPENLRKDLQQLLARLWLDFTWSPVHLGGESPALPSAKARAREACGGQASEEDIFIYLEQHPEILREEEERLARQKTIVGTMAFEELGWE